MPVTRRPVDRHARIQEALARLIDILDLIGDMAEIAPAIIDFARAAILRRPVIGQFDLRIFIPRRGEIDEGEAPLFAVEPLDLFQSQQVEKGDRLFDVTDADHAMQEFGQVFLHSSL